MFLYFCSFCHLCCRKFDVLVPYSHKWDCYSPSKDSDEWNDSHILKNKTDNGISKRRRTNVKIKEDTTVFKFEVTLPLYVTSILVLLSNWWCFQRKQYNTKLSWEKIPLNGSMVNSQKEGILLFLYKIPPVILWGKWKHSKRPMV